jgi:triphosphatase
MADSQEIELKFLCAPGDLAAVLAAAPAGDDDTRELISVYFDTADRALQKVGATLRVRESKGRRVQTLKRGEGLTREEYEEDVDSDVPDPEFGPLKQLLNGGRHELKPAFNVRVTRRQRLVRYNGSEIELALDEGEVRGGRAASAISEVELELKAGQPSALFELARDLSQAAPLYLSFDGKAARGQALVEGEPLQARRREKVKLKKDATAGEAFQAAARNALGQIAANAVVLREDAQPDAVHQLRVAARRLRSTLATFKAIVADDQFARLKDELKWLGKACDTARNLDVFCTETIAPAKQMDAPPKGLADLEKAVIDASAKARGAVVEAVSSERFRSLVIDAAAWVETGAWLANPAAAEPAKAFAAEVLGKRRRKLKTTGQDLVAADDVTRHRTRIEAKKLRYAAEGFANLFAAKAADRFIGRVKALQEVLGHLNDTATAETLIADLKLKPAAAFAAGELVGLRAADKAELVSKAARDLRRVAKAERFWG